MEIEQVEVTKRLGVTLDCKRSWSKHVDAALVKAERSLSIIKSCSAFLSTLSTRQVLQAIILSHLAPATEGPRKITIGSEQGSTAGPEMYTEI